MQTFQHFESAYASHSLPPLTDDQKVIIGIYFEQNILGGMKLAALNALRGWDMNVLLDWEETPT